MKKALLVLLLLVMTTSVFGQVTNKNVTFLWTAPGDDGPNGTASIYDIRYFTDTLDLINWATATQVTGEPIPKVSGAAESFNTTLPLLEGVTYFFAIRTSDETGNWSGLSNNVTSTFSDTSAPGVIIDFR